jgi:hypothetical protein
LPVPLSPVISTAVGVSATCVMVCPNPDQPERTQEDLSPRENEEPK